MPIVIVYFQHPQNEQKTDLSLASDNAGRVGQNAQPPLALRDDCFGIAHYCSSWCMVPAYDWSGRFYVENLPNVQGLDFLEIGCGTGLISVFAARGGAKMVVAVDINPKAVENTVLNFNRFDIESAEAFVSKGFQAVKGLFDVVAFNAPYHGCKPNDMLEYGCADENYQGLKAFLRGRAGPS